MTMTDHEKNADSERLRAALVDTLVASGRIVQPEIEFAFRFVPRHTFLPRSSLTDAYRDEGVKTAATSSSSQPSIMATMLERLDLRPGHRVLELGAGTGYNAALMQTLVGPTGRVVSVEVDEALAETARANLARAGVHGVEVVAEDAMHWPTGEEFDRVIFTYAVSELPDLLQRLPDGAIVVAPLVLRANVQKIVTWTWTDGHMVATSTADCSFLPQVSAAGMLNPPRMLGAYSGVAITANDPTALDVGRLTELVHGRQFRSDTLGFELTTRQALSGLNAWIATHDVRACSIGAIGNAAESDIVPWISGYEPGFRMCTSFGLTDGSNLALFAAPPGVRPAAFRTPDAPPYEAHLWVYDGAEPLGGQLAENITGWRDAGYPLSDSLRIHAVPGGVPADLQDEPAVIAKGGWYLHCCWT